MHSNSIRPSALTSLTLASIYILSPYVPICSLANCFIYYTHIDIASVPVLTCKIFVYRFFDEGLRERYGLVSADLSGISKSVVRPNL